MLITAYLAHLPSCEGQQHEHVTWACKRRQDALLCAGACCASIMPCKHNAMLSCVLRRA